VASFAKAGGPEKNYAALEPKSKDQSIHRNQHKKITAKKPQRQ